MKAVLLACVILFSASSAQAQPMGPSPEAGFAGTWRIIDARPAPWIKPHALSREEVPLLEFALAFRDGEVMGPSPIACGHAGYKSMPVTVQELFSGGVPEGKEDETAHALGLSASGTTVLRVDCETGTFHFALKDGSLLFVLDNIVYTMERAKLDTGPGYSGPSFDCAKARTAGEKLICFDEDLSKFDREMAAAYTRLSKTETPESFATVQAAQRAWLAFTTKFCDANGESPDNSCLNESYQDRSGRLNAIEVVEAGTLRLEPRMRFFSRVKPRVQESDSYPWMTGGPKAAAFNTYIARKLELDKRRMDDKKLFPSGNDLPENMLLALRRTYSVSRFDSRIASLLVWTYDFTGGAHEALNEFSLNWDVERGKPIGFDDIFAKGKKWEQFVIDYCVDNLEDQFNEESGPDRSAVARVVGNIGNWLFDRNKAIVHFTVYTVASFSGGEFDVEIPYEELKPYMRPDAPVL